MFKSGIRFYSESNYGSAMVLVSFGLATLPLVEYDALYGYDYRPIKNVASLFLQTVKNSNPHMKRESSSCK